jgi:hypothetical protein
MDNPPPRELVELRLQAEQSMRAKDDRTLLDLSSELRSDEECWVHLWAPAVAIAARRLGSPDALAILEEAVAGGFRQPELFDGELEKQFCDDAGWPEIQRRMQAEVPLPLLELLQWPDAGAVVPVELYEISPARLEALRERLPAKAASAWETATRLLAWVHQRWVHANDHVDEPDALEVLERVDKGARFACVEYSIVLSQALNAVGIPARRVDLRQRGHHVGIGRSHVVSEAWIDDLDRWVLLDGQNGSYWVGSDDAPLGVRELQRLHSAGDVPRFVGAGDVASLSGNQAAAWFSYFASVTTTGCTWASAGFTPIFQGIRVIRTPRLLHDGDLAYPRLSGLSTGLAGTVVEPVVRFRAYHPYASGVRLRTGSAVIDLDDAEWKLDLSPGTHELTVSVLTPYGETSGLPFSYVVRAGGAQR